MEKASASDADTVVEVRVPAGAGPQHVEAVAWDAIGKAWRVVATQVAEPSSVVTVRLASGESLKVYPA